MKRIFVFLICALLLAATGQAETAPAAASGALLSYDLGAGGLRDSNGNEVVYQRQGVLGIPAEKGGPVVVLVHGAHAIETASESRYDTGFDYLIRALSEQGNLVISPNVAINYSFEDGEPVGNERTHQILSEQLALLKRAVDGDRQIFGRDLTGLGDFNRIVFMGHSRGGLDVMEYAAKLPEGMRAAGVVCVAPSAYKNWETSFPDVPVGILLPEMDGDVISMDGGDMFEDLVAEDSYRKPAELIYLKKANHAYFNTRVTPPDLNHNEADVARLMPPERQRGFLRNYLSEFVKNATRSGQTVLSGEAAPEGTLYGLDILARVHDGTGKALWSAQDGEAPVCTGSAVCARQTVDNVPRAGSVETFNMPGDALENYALERVAWREADAGVRFPLASDLTSFRFLNLDMAVDSTDIQNAGGQSMNLVLEDAQGSAARYAVPRDAAALLWQAGELLEQDSWDGGKVTVYSAFTPLVTLRVPLSAFKGVDLSRIAALILEWPEPHGGSVMLRGFSASK